jgi:hypothetical protein
MGSNSSKSTGPPALIVDEVLYWVQAACQPTYEWRRFCTESPESDPNKPCIHAQTLLSCLKTSKSNFSMAAKYLWSKYSNFEDLMALVTHPVNDEFDDCDDCVSPPTMPSRMRGLRVISSVKASLKLRPQVGQHTQSTKIPSSLGSIQNRSTAT